jgi:hypothetical protein
VRQLFAFGDRFEFRIDLRQLALVQTQLGHAALVIDRHRRLVGHGPLDVVDADDYPRESAVKIEGATRRAWEGKSPKTAHVLASVFSIGVPVNPMNDAFGSESRSLCASPYQVLTTVN